LRVFRKTYQLRQKGIDPTDEERKDLHCPDSGQTKKQAKIQVETSVTTQDAMLGEVKETGQNDARSKK